MSTKTFDVIVIGAGSAGENAAEIAVKNGLSAVIIESELVGGECTYWACMPSKALLRPGNIANAASRVPGFAGGEIDVDAALERRNAMASNWDDAAQVEWLEGAGIELLRGHGRIVGPRLVEVESGDGSVQRLEAARAVMIATGTAASIPPIDGLADSHPWDSRDITTATEVPERLLIIGGGVVGVEMAQAWKSLGSKEVTIIELDDRLLAGEEPEAGVELKAALERENITVHLDAKTSRVARESKDSPVTTSVTLTDGSEIDIETDEIVVATGRRPNTSSIGLERIGLEPGRYIEVDDHLVATGVDGDWLYAVGDVNGRSLLTHTGKYQARIAGAHVAGVETSAWGDLKATPRVVFTHPQIASVGMTESEALAEGVNVKAVTHDIGSVAGAPSLGRGYHGTTKLVVDADRGVIVGATFVGPETGEMLHAATIAIIGEVTIDTLWHAVPSFPTLSEVWLRLLETYRDEYGHVFK